MRIWVNKQQQFRLLPNYYGPCYTVGKYLLMVSHVTHSMKPKWACNMAVCSAWPLLLVDTLYC